MRQRNLAPRDKELIRACNRMLERGEWDVERWYVELGWAGFTINYDTGDYEKNG